MNILPFVMALLLALTILTTTKLHTLKTLMTIRAKYLLYMKEAESIEFSQCQREKYDAKHKNDGSEEEQESSDKSGKTRIRAVRKLNLLALARGDKSGKIDSYTTISIITKRLLNLLYKDQPFYQKIQEKRPDFLNELLEKLKANGPDYQERLGSVTDLAQIDIHDAELSEVFAKMLEGAIISPELLQANGEDKKSFRDVYPSLKDFTTYDKGIETIRIFLAPPELLMAIFNDENTVDSIIKTRKDHFKELRKHNEDDLTLPRQVLSEKFKSAFESKLPPELDKSLFNFEVTATSPNKIYHS